MSATVEYQFREAAALHQSLGGDTSPWQWIPIAADGACLFRAVATALDADLVPFGKEVARYAWSWIDEGSRPILDQCLGVLERCRAESGLIKALEASWNSGGGDLLVTIVQSFVKVAYNRQCSTGTWRCNDWSALLLLLPLSPLNCCDGTPF